MAVFFMEGFDFYAAADVNQRYISGTVGSMQTGLLGVGQAVSFGNAVGGGLKKFFASNFTTFIAGMRMKATGFNTTVMTMHSYLDSGGNVIGTLAVNSSGALLWYRGANSTLVATSANGLIALNGINYIEVKVTLSLTATGTVDIHLNGASVASASTVQTANTTASMNGFTWTATGGSTTGWQFDDCYFADTTGTANNDFLGDVKVVTVRPSAAGRSAQFAPNGAASNYLCVNETTPDGDTTYVSSSTAGQIDAYALSSAGSISALKAVQVNVSARKDDASTRTLAVGVGNGTTENFDAGTNLGSAYAMLTRTLDSNPLTSAAWATGDLTTLQGAIKCIA